MQSLANPKPQETALPASPRSIKSTFAIFRQPALVSAVVLVALLVTGLHAVAASFSNAVPLMTARGAQAAILLSNGKLLVTGGITNSGFTCPSTELYDPTTGTWSDAGSATAPMPS